MDARDSLDALLTDLLHHRSPGERARAAHRLGALRVTDTITALRQALRDPSQQVQHAAVVSLVRIGDTSLTADVTSRLRSAQEDVVIGAASILAEARHRPAVPALLQAFRTSNANIASAVAEALGAAGDGIALPLLCLALGHRFVPVAAANALGELGDARAIPVLLLTLETSKTAEVRAACARALGRIRRSERRRLHLSVVRASSRVVPALRAALADESPRVRVNAAIALWQLGDKNQGKIVVSEMQALIAAA